MLVQRQTRKYTPKVVETTDVNHTGHMKKGDGATSNSRSHGKEKSRQLISGNNSGSRFESLNQVDAKVRDDGVNLPGPAMHMETERPRVLSREPRMETQGGVGTQGLNKESDSIAEAVEFANKPEEVRSVPQLEGESRMDCVKVAGESNLLCPMMEGENLKFSNPVIPVKKGNPIDLGKSIPKLAPKISGSGDRIPLSSNSKVSAIRNPKFKKGYVKKASRLGVSGKENIASKSSAPSGSRVVSSAVTRRDHEPISDSHLPGVSNSSGHRDICGRTIGGTQFDSSPPASKPGEHRSEFLFAAGESESINVDEDGDSVCDGRPNEGLEGIVPIGTSPDSS